MGHNLHLKMQESSWGPSTYPLFSVSYLFLFFRSLRLDSRPAVTFSILFAQRLDVSRAMCSLQVGLDGHFRTSGAD